MWLEDLSDCSPLRHNRDSTTVIDVDGRSWSTPLCCGCRFVVGPGEQATIAMGWKARETSCAFNNYFRFSTNDPTRPQLRLTMRGRIIAGNRSADAHDSAGAGVLR
jgi:hypothetical protein